MHDSFKGGCPCGLAIESVAHELNKRKIKYKLIRIGDFLTDMAKDFQKHISKYEECTLKEAASVFSTV